MTIVLLSAWYLKVINTVSFSLQSQGGFINAVLLHIPWIFLSFNLKKKSIYIYKCLTCFNMGSHNCLNHSDIRLNLLLSLIHCDLQPI